MKLLKVYNANTPTAFLLQGFGGIVAGLVLAVLYSLFTHENGVRRFGFLIVAVPVALTVFKLLLYFGMPKEKKNETKQATPGTAPSALSRRDLAQ